MAGAPLGNKNAAKNRPWAAAIERALSKRSLADQRDALDDLAEALLSKCGDGDMAALKELGDRLDGKVSQQVILAGDRENPLSIEAIQRTVIDPKA